MNDRMSGRTGRVAAVAVVLVVVCTIGAVAAFAGAGDVMTGGEDESDVESVAGDETNQPSSPEETSRSVDGAGFTTADGVNDDGVGQLKSSSESALLVDGEGDEPDTYETIEEALDAVEEGGAIEIDPGVHEGGVVSVDTDDVVLLPATTDGGADERPTLEVDGLDVIADGVVLQALEIEPQDSEVAVHVLGDDVEVSDSVVTGDVDVDLMIDGGGDVTVERNAFEGGLDGLVSLETRAGDGDITAVNNISANDTDAVVAELFDENELDELDLDGERYAAEPEAVFDYDPPDPVAGDAVEFDAGPSEGQVDDYTWTVRTPDGDDAEFGFDEVEEYTFQVAGEHEVELRVSGPGGEDTAATSIHVEDGDEPGSGDGVDVAWNYSYDSIAESELATSEEAINFVHWDEETDETVLTSLNAADGELRWSTASDGSQRILGTDEFLIAVDEGEGAELTARELESGGEAWSFDVSDDWFRYNPTRYDEATDTVYAVADGSTTVLDATDGSTQTTVEDFEPNELVRDDDAIYGAESGDVRAFTPDGQTVWTESDRDGDPWYAAVGPGGTVVFGDNDELTAYQRSAAPDGSQVAWEFEPDDDIRDVVATDDDYLVVAGDVDDDASTLYAVDGSGDETEVATLDGSQYGFFEGDTGTYLAGDALVRLDDDHEPDWSSDRPVDELSLVENGDQLYGVVEHGDDEGESAVRFDPETGDSATLYETDDWITFTAFGDEQLYLAMDTELLALEESDLRAAFDYEPDHPIEGEEVEFDGTGSVGEVDEYVWYVDGEKKETGPEFTHEFGDEPSYEVTLEVTDTDGETDATTETVEMAEEAVPEADFTYEPESPAVGDWVVFEADDTIDPDEYVWTVDGEVEQSAEDSTFETVFYDPGEYEVRLNVSGPGGSDTNAETVEVTEEDSDPELDAQFDVDPETAEVSDPITFDAGHSEGPVEDYEWDFDDGTTDTGTTVTHAYDTEGEYTVELTISDDDGNTDTATETVTIEPEPVEAPTAVINHDADGPEAGEFVGFDAIQSDGEIDSYAWDFGDGNTATGPETGHAYDEAGTYTVELTVTGPGGSDTDTATISVDQAYEAPNAAIDASTTSPEAEASVTFDASGTTGDVDSYHWDFGDGSSATGQTATHAFDDVGTFDVAVTAQGPAGSDTATVTVDVSQPDLGVSISPEEPLQGETVVFEARAASSPSWTFGDGSSASGQRVSHAYDEPGTYDVTVTDGQWEETHEVDVEAADVTVSAVDRDHGGTPLASLSSLAGASYEDTFSVEADAETSVEYVEFDLDGETAIESGGGTASETFDLGELDDDAVLTVTAVDENGVEATTETRVPVTTVPAWMEWLLEQADVTVDERAGEIHVSYEPFTLDYDFEIGTIPIDASGQAFEGAPAANVAYDANVVGATVGGGGDVGGTVFGYGLEADVAVDGTIDRNLQLARASAAGSANAYGQAGPALQVDIPRRESIEVGTTINPGVDVEGEFDDELAFQQGTVTPGVTLTVGASTSIPGGSAGVEASGGMDASFDVGTQDRNLGGTADVGGEGWIEISRFDTGFEVGPYEYDVGSGARAAGEPAVVPTSSDGWTVQSKHGENPVDGVASGGEDDAVASSGLQPLGDPFGEYDRLSNRTLEDTQPAVTVADGDLVVAWSRQAADKDAEDGLDVVVRSYDGDEWSTAENLTDDRTSDETPALAAREDGSILAAWSTLDAHIGDEGLEEPADAHPHYEIEYAVYDDGEWSEPAALTADTDARQFEPTVAPSDDGWLVAWERDQSVDGNDTDVSVAAVSADGPSDGDASADAASIDVETIPEAGHPAVGPHEDGAALAYAPLDDGEPDGVVSTQVADGELVDEKREFDAGGVRDVVTADDRTVWLEGTVTDPALVDATGDESSEVELHRNVTSVSELSLTSHDESAVLSYRASDEDSNTTDLVYRLDRGDGWITDRTFAGAPDEDLTVWFSETAFGGDGDAFHTGFAAQPLDRNATNDVFVATHDFRPEYDIDGDVDPAAAGDETEIEYEVRNVGDVVGTADVEVTADSDGERVADETHEALEAGETVNGTFTATVDESGTFDLSVSHVEASTLEDEQAGDATTVTAATPNLSVGAIDAEPVDDELHLEAELHNDGGAAATDVPVEFSNGTGAIATNETDVQSGESAVVSATVEPDALNETVGDRVEIDPEGELSEDAVSEGTAITWFVRPDLRVDDVAFEATDDELHANVLVRTDEPVGAQAMVEVRTASDDAVLGSTNASVEPAAHDEPTFETVEVPVDAVDSGTEVFAVADSSVPDRDPGSAAATGQVDVEVQESDGSGAGGGAPPAPPADESPMLVIEDVDVPAEVDPGETVTATVSLVNEGDDVGSTAVSLEIAGDAVTSDEIELLAGDETTVGVTIDAPDEPGPHELTVETSDDDATVTIDVADAEDATDDESTAEDEDEADDAFGVPGFSTAAALAAIALALAAVAVHVRVHGHAARDR